MILSGEKTEEYREVKPYWVKRLMTDELAMKSFAGVLFTNGYNRDSRRLSMFIEKISIGFGREDWGAEPGKKYFIIKLKKIA